MFIAMNRFKIIIGKESDFINIWKNRETLLNSVPGFKEFHLLQGDSTNDFTLFVSHAIWESANDFENWTKSEAFRKAHSNAGANKGIYLGPPVFEGFQVIL